MGRRERRAVDNALLWLLAIVYGLASLFIVAGALMWWLAPNLRHHILSPAIPAVADGKPEALTCDGNGEAG